MANGWALLPLRCLRVVDPPASVVRAVVVERAVGDVWPSNDEVALSDGESGSPLVEGAPDLVGSSSWLGFLFSDLAADSSTVGTAAEGAWSVSVRSWPCAIRSASPSLPSCTSA